MDDTWEDYDARDIARTVAQTLLEKSSTPSVNEYLENYTEALEGIIKILSMKHVGGEDGRPSGTDN